MGLSGGGPWRKRTDCAVEETRDREGVGRRVNHHLGYAKTEAAEEVENHRNGYTRTVVGEDGAMEIEVPRDRSGSFEPLLIAKGQKRFETSLRRVSRCSAWDDGARDPGLSP